MNSLQTKYERRKAVLDYIKEHNPYEPHQSLGYNLRAVSAYAREKNIPLDQLTEEELKQFAN